MKRHLHVIGLGANLGTPLATLRLAVAVLARQPGVALRAASPVYRSEPVGPPQPDYLNAAIGVATDLPAGALLARLEAIETALGRNRAREARWGARTLDLDMLWSDEPVDQPDLSVPHPRLEGRWWAVQPLLDVMAVLSAVGDERASVDIRHYRKTLVGLGGRRKSIASLHLPSGETAPVSLRERDPQVRLSAPVVGIAGNAAGGGSMEALMSLLPALRPVQPGGSVPPPARSGRGRRPRASSPPGFDTAESLRLRAVKERDVTALIRCQLGWIGRGDWPVCAAICSSADEPLRARALTVKAPPRRFSLSSLSLGPRGATLELREHVSENS